MILLVSIKCWQRDGERTWGVLGRKYYALGNMQNHFMTSLLRDEEGGDIDTGTEPRAVARDDICTAVISVSFTLVIRLVRQV